MSQGDAAADRIAPPPWMLEPATQAVLKTLATGGVAARFVGGCVRDTWLGRPIGDIDIATPAEPQEVMRLLAAAGIKVVPTGLQHGTVTAVVAPRHFEITTLRHDVETFGRHARVAFTDDWAADAQRRDFTMNALFLDGEGRIFDPVGGLPDLRAGHVRFVGDAATRIREDVLRLLRFYRFHAHYGRAAADEEARAACRALAYLLPTLSGERVAAELLKLLAAPDPIPTLKLMTADGVLAVLLPEACRLDRLQALLPLEPSALPDPLYRLGALLASDAAYARAVAERLRLANTHRDRLVALAAPPWPVTLADDKRVQRQALYHLGRDLYRDLVRLRLAEEGKGQSDLVFFFLYLDTWQSPEFPLKGRDVRQLGIPAGRAVGRLLAEVRAWWEAGDFQADRTACLAELRRLVSEHGAGGRV